MNLSNDDFKGQLLAALRNTIIQRVQQASVPEILSITGSICGNGKDHAPAPARPDGPRFQLDSATVLDTTTGLRWTRETVAGGRRNWADAHKAAAAVDLYGFTDWRLPTIKELLTLVDYERYEPAIDTSVFQCEPSWYWTSTPAASSPADYAWLVNFSYGNALWLHQGSDGFVRAVRASQ